MKSRTDDEPVGGKVEVWGSPDAFRLWARRRERLQAVSFLPRDATNKEASRDQSDNGDEKQ